MSERFNDIDLAITEDGDLILDGNGDLSTVVNLDYVVQMAKNRLKSVDIDWFYDNIGANIEGSIGQPNTRETADLLTQRIVNALTIDNFCTEDDVLVLASPVNATKIVVGVFINTNLNPKPIEFAIELDFLTGFKIIRRDE